MENDEKTYTEQQVSVLKRTIDNLASSVAQQAVTIANLQAILEDNKQKEPIEEGIGK